MRALVIGGTGPSGQHVIDAISAAGFDVSVFHRPGRALSSPSPVTEILGDPFAAVDVERVFKATWDLVIALYGKLILVSAAARGRCGKLVAVTGSPAYRGVIAPTKHGAGRLLCAPAAVPLREDDPVVADPLESLVGFRVAEAERAVMEAADQGAYAATIIRYPAIYGPRQRAPFEWAIVRRLLDGRDRIIMPDDGMMLLSRAYGANAAHAVELAALAAATSPCSVYNVAEPTTLPVSEWTRKIAKICGVNAELVAIPYDHATPAYSYAPWPHHVMLDSTKIRRELSFREKVEPSAALEQTVQQLIEHRPDPGGSEEREIRDRFDYAHEDALIEAWQRHAPDLTSPPPAEGMRRY